MKGPGWLDRNNGEHAEARNLSRDFYGFCMMIGTPVLHGVVGVKLSHLILRTDVSIAHIMHGRHPSLDIPSIATYCSKNFTVDCAKNCPTCRVFSTPFGIMNCYSFMKDCYDVARQ